MDIKKIKLSRLVLNLMDVKSKKESNKDEIVRLKSDAIKKQKYEKAAELRDKEKTLIREIESIDDDIKKLKDNE